LASANSWRSTNTFECHLVQRLRKLSRSATSFGQTPANVAPGNALERNLTDKVHSGNAFEPHHGQRIRGSSRSRTVGKKTQTKAVSLKAFRSGGCNDIPLWNGITAQQALAADGAQRPRDRAFFERWHRPDCFLDLSAPPLKRCTLARGSSRATSITSLVVV
jgi:hypothetical protein